MFLLENVAAMATHLKGKTMAAVVDAFSDAGSGYTLQWEVLNSVNYGCGAGAKKSCNHRHSEGCKNGIFLSAKCDHVYTVKEAIGDLPPLESGETSDIPNHVAMNHSAQMLRKMSYVRMARPQRYSGGAASKIRRYP